MGLPLVEVTDLSAAAHRMKYQVSAVAYSEQVHCANTLRMCSSNSETGNFAHTNLSHTQEESFPGPWTVPTF